MDTDFVFKRVQQMRPSSFSEEERHCYQAEKKILRQFMLLKQQDQVPAYLSVQHMKTWLLTGRNFMEEFQEMIGRLEIKHLLMAELAWTTARRFCLAQMEQEVQEELDKEKQLSQLLCRKVTLQGLQMFVSGIHPKAEESVQTFIPSLHSKLLLHFGGIRLRPVSAGDPKPAELLELEQSTAPVVPEVVNTALKFLLEEPETEGKAEAASAEVGRLLTDSAAPCLSQYGPVCTPLLLGVCTIVGRYMVRAIFKEFEHRSKTFHLMDYDESSFTVREGVISVIQDMECEVQTAASSQAHLQLSTSELLQEGLMEEREASPEVAATEDLKERLLEEREASPEVSSTEALQEELMEEREASPEVAATEDLKERLLEEREASPEVSSTEALQEELMEEREASPEVAATEDLKERLLEEREASPGVSSTEALQEELMEEREASPEVAATEDLKERLLEEREASPEVSSTEALQEGLLEEREASPEVAATEDLKEELLEEREASPGVSSTEALQEGLLEEREASPVVAATEDLKEGLLEEREASPEVSAKGGLKEGLVEERQASPGVAATEDEDERTTTETTSNVVMYMEPELEVLQEDVEAQDFNVKRKKKKRVRAFFRGIWKKMSCCFRCSSED